MAERGAEEPQIVLIDTNVIIKGAIDLLNNVESPEARVWSAFLDNRLKAAFSDVLLFEVVAVARRLMGKDFASELRSQVLGKAEVISKEELIPYIPRLSREIPKENLAHAALAAVVEVRYVVSNDREFLRSMKDKFKCVTPKSLVK